MPTCAQGVYRRSATQFLAVTIIGVGFGLCQPSLADDWRVLSGADLKATVDDKTWKGRYWRVYWGSNGERLHWSEDTKGVNKETWWMESDGITLCADSEARGRLCIQVEELRGKLRAVELQGPYAGQKFPFDLLDGQVDF